METHLLLAVLLTSFTMGWASAPWALAVFLGIVAPLSSLPWQLGLRNLALPLVFLLGALSGTLSRAVLVDRQRSASDSRRCDPPVEARRQHELLRTCALLFMVTLAVPFSLAIVRGVPLTQDLVELHAATVSSDLPWFAPEGIAGMIHAFLIPTVGVSVFLVIFQIARDRRARTVLLTAVCAGASLAVVSPLIQHGLGLDLIVRPDQRGSWGSGWVGFFQDPHSYAAFLVLMMGVLLGLFLKCLSARKWLRATAALALGVAAFSVILYTNSRGGLVASVLLVGLVTMGAPWALAKVSSRPSWAMIMAAAAPLFLVVSSLIVAYAGPDAVRERAYERLVRLGNPRMWEIIDPKRDAAALLESRIARWQSATRVVTDHPLTGIGPGRIGTASPLLQDNAHNYYLQMAAEFGLPTLGCFLTLVGGCLRLVGRGAFRAGDAGERSFLLGVFAAQVAFLGFSLVSHPLLLPELQGTLWALTGLAVAVSGEAAPTAESPW